MPEWIDFERALLLAYYIVLFDKATDVLFEELGIGYAYRKETDRGTFVAETHNRYERELLVHEKVSVTTQLVAADDKRLHLAHEMFRLKDGLRAATQELMFLHVDLKARRVCPFPPELKARVADAVAAHAWLSLRSRLRSRRKVEMPR